MHSRVFQISTTQIDKENYLNEDTLNQGDNSFYDYCADISDEERKEEITNHPAERNVRTCIGRHDTLYR